MSALTVSEISARSPEMDTTEFAALVEDIRVNGQLVPIWVVGEEVIDGRKRLAACKQLGIEPIVANVRPDQDPESLSRSLNEIRTHYTPSQRAMLAERRANATRLDGPMRAICQLTDRVVTVREAADAAGVAATQVNRARKIRRSAAPEVVAAVEAGKLTLHAASQIAKQPREKQPEATALVMASSKGKRRNTPASVLSGTKPIHRRQPTRASDEQIETAIGSLEFHAQHIERCIGDVTEFRDWAKRLRVVRTELSRLISKIEGE